VIGNAAAARATALAELAEFAEPLVDQEIEEPEEAPETLQRTAK